MYVEVCVSYKMYVMYVCWNCVSYKRYVMYVCCSLCMLSDVCNVCMLKYVYVIRCM